MKEFSEAIQVEAAAYLRRLYQASLGWPRCSLSSS